MAKSKENLELKELEFDDDGICIQDGAEANVLKPFSTGSLGLDILSGGLTSGLIQIWGPDGIGKTTLFLTMGGEFQAFHKYEFCRVYLHATEGRYNPRLCTMAPKLKSVSENKKDVNGNGEVAPIFRISRPKNGESMCDFILKTLKQDKIKFFHIIDSIDGISSVANEGKSMSENEKTASTATLLTKFFKEASGYANHYGHIIACTNQIRDKISQGPSHVSGVGKQKSGGHAADHYSNLRLHASKIWTDLKIFENPNDKDSRVIGHIMELELEKTSNSGHVYSKAKVPFIYDLGVDREREIAILSELYGLVKRNGAWYVLDGENIAQGINKYIVFLKEKKDIANRLESDIKKIGGVTF